MQQSRAGSIAALALPAIIFLLLYSWRPWKLGLYSDDWLYFLHPQPRSLAALSDFISLYRNRPVSALTGFVAQVAGAWNPAALQVVSFTLLALSAASVGWLTYALTGRWFADRQPVRFLGAGVAAAAYLAFPWTLGFSWATAAISATPATVLFCAAAVLLIGPSGAQLGTQILAALLMGTSFLAYEAFYGQFVIILVLATLARIHPIRAMPRPLLFMSIVNIACFGYNRFAGGNTKEVTTDWVRSFLNSYYHYLWPNLLMSFREVAPIIIVSLAIALCVGATLLAKITGGWRVAAAFLAIVTGIFAAGLLYAIAGYPLITVGTFARVTLVQSLYGALLLGLLSTAAAVRLQKERWLPRLQIGATIVLVGTLATASAYRLTDWVDSWQAQLAVLRQLPVDARRVPDAKQAYLYIGPLGPTNVPIASAPWEIPGTIAYLIFRDDPALARRIMTDVLKGSGSHWLAATPGSSIDFNDHALMQRGCGSRSPMFSLTAEELWIWKVGEPRLKKAPMGFEIGCNATAATK